MNGTGGLTTEKTQSKVTKEVEQILNVLDQQSNFVAQLEGKIQSALTPTPPTPGEAIAKEPPPPPSATLTDVLKEIKTRILNTNHLLLDLNRRIEL